MSLHSPDSHPLDRAIRWAIEALAQGSTDLPEAPPGWSIRAAGALTADEPIGLMVVGLELRAAHSQYRADFDVRSTLWELRQALPHPLREYIAAGVPVQHLLQPKHPSEATT